MSELQLQPIPANDPESRIQALEAKLAQLDQRSRVEYQNVGDWKLVRYLPPLWDSGNLVLVDGVYAVPNGVSIGRTDFPTLNSLASAAGYPDGYADANSFYLPDALGRCLVVVGTNADVNNGDKDAMTLPNRTPRHQHSKSLSAGSHQHALGASASASTTIAPNPHYHDLYHGAGSTTGGVGGGNAWDYNASDDTAYTSLTATTTLSGYTNYDGGGSVSGTIGPTVGTYPQDSPAYLVIGIILLRVLP